MPFQCKTSHSTSVHVDGCRLGTVAVSQKELRSMRKSRYKRKKLLKVKFDVFGTVEEVPVSQIMECGGRNYMNLATREKKRRRLESISVPPCSQGKEQVATRPTAPSQPFVDTNHFCKVCGAAPPCICTGVFCPKCGHQMYRCGFNLQFREEREEHEWLVGKHSIDCKVCKHLSDNKTQGTFKCKGCYLHVGLNSNDL